MTDLTQLLVSLIATQVPGLAVVYLFGSRARGEDGPDADIDLAILAQEKLDPVRRWELQEDLAALAHRNVDLVDLRQASSVMRAQVLKDSQVLYEALPSLRANFEVMALSAYARLNEERREILKDVAARGRIHG